MSLSLVMSLASDVARLIVGNRQGLGARGYVAFSSVTEYFHGGALSSITKMSKMDNL